MVSVGVVLRLCVWLCYGIPSTDVQAHVQLLEANTENHPLLIMGMDYLVNISYVDVSADRHRLALCMSDVKGLYAAGSWVYLFLARAAWD